MKVGILGGGQLGRMLALAGTNLGLRFRCYDETPDAVAGHCAELVVGGFTDTERLARFEDGLDVVTYEFENVPAIAAEHLSKRVPTFPGPGALAICQDRLEEKSLFKRLGIGCAAFAAVDTRQELDEAARKIGLASVLKTRRLGYDGKGQMVLREPKDVERAWTLLGGGAGASGGSGGASASVSPALILEAFVPFERELSILAVRGRPDSAGAGQTVFYPLVENHHSGGILRVSKAPAPGVTPALQKQAEEFARRALDAMNYVGVMAMELFAMPASGGAPGELLANEMAPRVHNSGHWTMDGAVTSQFENHIRAVCGMPLGDCGAIGHAGMLNVIGDAPPIDQLLALPGARVHMYGKTPRPGRKIGHVNFREDSAALLERNMAGARGLIERFAC